VCSGRRAARVGLASNSLVGSTLFDQVGVGGYGGVTELTNGNYVVWNPF